MHMIWMIVLGLIVGLTARLIVPGKQPTGWVAGAARKFATSRTRTL
jgi:uncharacterized membrane protein YeaQ/YmgE (transglycosylase-associated protein family)